MRSNTLLLSAVALAATGLAAEAGAQETLAQVEERGHLNCQVGLPTPGFYALADDGTWSGIDVDICRAVSAAIFGDPDQIEYQSRTSANRFTSLANGESDMLSRTTTWTAVRDTQLGMTFAGTNFYDGQGFMVPRDLGVSSVDELDGATICVLTGTTTELNLADYFRANDLDYEPVTNENVNVIVENYLGGGCDAYTNDRSGLAARRSAFPNPDDHVILPETISKEPLGPVVREGDENWSDIVRWVLFGMIEAEEVGIDSDNLDEMLESDDPKARRILGVEGDVGEGLGLEDDFMVDVIRTVGNYGEVYERNIGADTPIGLERDGTLNAQWTEGGILYAMPFR
ncbi:MAG: amino acid ABC transporter substrate-binding protein [Pseudomonadota bacterium]